jgi:small-conductance mechanosensitive channel
MTVLVIVVIAVVILQAVLEAAIYSRGEADDATQDTIP